jgi:hypothetical protein
VKFLESIVNIFRNRRALSCLETLESRAYLSAITFANHVDSPVGANLIAIVTADFNNDGKLDIATADSSLDRISVFFGTGTGSFNNGPVLTLNVSPTSLVAGDFNHDGFPDLAAGSGHSANSSGTSVTVFLNNQNSNFGTGQITRVVTASTLGDQMAMTTGDFNGDGNLDIATADFNEATTSILLGTGLGTFQSPVTYPVGLNPTSIVVGNFNSTASVDLAVAGQRPNGSGGNSDVVTLLNGTATGTFTPGPDIAVSSSSPQTLTATELNGDGLTDLADGNLLDSVIVLTSNGSEQYSISPTISTSGPVSAVAVDDFNFDGSPDLLAAEGGTIAVSGSDSVAISTGLTGGSFSSTLSIPSGSLPVAIAVGDFNGDRKLDIATANSGDGTFTVLLNTSAGTPQEATTISLTTSAATAPFGTSVQLTATITGPVDAVGLPTGNVNFYQGATLLGTAVIAGGTNQAVFSSTTLGVGTDPIIARYQGDGTFSTSASTALNETITPTPGNGPDLIATFVSTTLPAQFSPGEKATVKFTLTNAGNFTATGAITNTLYLSLDNMLDSGDIPVTIKGSLAGAKLKLAKQKSMPLTGNFTVPAGTPLGDYVLLVDVNATNSLLESDTTNNTAVSPTLLTAVDAFGNVGGRANVSLVLPDVDGTQVTYKLTGPGMGTVNVGDSGSDLSLTGTTAASALTISGKGGDSLVELHDFSADSAIGTIKALTTSVSGDATLSGGVTRLQLNNGNNLTLGAGAASTLVLGGADVIDNSTWNVTSAAGIKSLKFIFPQGPSGIQPLIVASGPASGGAITAPWIGTLAAQTGQVDLNLSGVGSPGGVALGSVNLAAPLTSANWSVTGAVGKVALHGVSSEVSINIAGPVKTLTNTGDFGGNIAASLFGSVVITGDLSGDILAGANFGADGLLGGGDDTFAAGSITSLRIGGSATAAALVAAGLDPVDDVLMDGNDVLIPGGFIKSITVNGSADPASRFLAATLPVKVKIGKTTVIPSADPRFML